MSQGRKQILLATAVMVAVFGFYEIAKTALFPGMSVVTSHLVSTLIVGLITFVISRYVVREQFRLLAEREQSNERLREALGAAERSGNLLASIVASVAEGLIITDRDSHVLLVNDAARRLLGLQRPAGRLSEISRDPQIHRTFSAVLSTGEGAEARIEIWMEREDGEEERRVLRLHASPLRLGASQIDGVVGVFIDMTKIERLERVRQEFLANVSHELRTPLASITAYVETLLAGALNDSENSLRFLHTIERNAERMRDLVNDVAELSAIEAGDARLSLEQLPLRTVVAEVFNGLAYRSARHGIHLRNRVDEGYRVTADRRRLEQILTNLIDNAIKFNRPGGEVIVTASTSADAQAHLIRVRDTGPGIAPEHLPRVFERFYRVDKARSREAGGTGLGLAIVKHLARAHGGEAYVTSELGSGCEFTIKLPVRSAAAPPSDEPKAIASRG